MTKNFLETASRIALFRGRESEPGQFSESGGAAVDLDAGSAITSSVAAAHDGELIHGAELPRSILAGPREAAGKLSQSRAKPDFIAFVLAYFFGECASAPAGGSAFEHVITPMAGLELPSFTALQRRGSGIFMERLGGNYLEAFTLELGEGWVSISAEVVGTGAREVNYEREVVKAPANALEITLAENGVAGATGAERLENLYRVRARDAGSQVWRRLLVSAVSGDAPAVVSFAEALGSSGDEVDYHLDYLPTAAEWCEIPAAVDESPLRLVEARLVVDGWWSGSELLGGEELKAELMAFSVSGQNHLELRHFPGETGPAALALRGGRELTITLTESLRDTIRQFQADHPETEHLSLSLLIQGAEIEPGGARFGAELIFPRVGILKAPVIVQNGRLASAGDLVVMDDGVHGGVVIRCYNQQAGYL